MYAHKLLFLLLPLLALTPISTGATIKISIQDLSDPRLESPGPQWPVHASGSPTCPKGHDVFELNCGKGITTTKDCHKWCTCDGEKLTCPETEDCSEESIDYMCGEISACKCGGK